MKMEPINIHNTAGPHPQMDKASMGPITGAAPDMLEKWCPKRTIQFFAGTKSTPSYFLWAGVSVLSDTPKSATSLLL